jgi:sigma-B regulation protein RsbU (phosphoserine phosphatase)
MEAVRACRQQPATEMIDSLMRDADAFVAGAPQHDDMTIMVVKLVQTDSATTGLPARH